MENKMKTSGTVAITAAATAAIVTFIAAVASEFKDVNRRLCDISNKNSDLTIEIRNLQNDADFCKENIKCNRENISDLRMKVINK
jgi:hypothetical protein